MDIKAILYHSSISVKKIEDSNKIVNAMAGVSCAKLAKFCYKNEIAGFEFIHGVPGSIGGALAMNAGAFGDEIWNHVNSVRCILNNGKVYTFKKRNKNIISFC